MCKTGAPACTLKRGEGASVPTEWNRMVSLFFAEEPRWYVRPPVRVPVSSGANEAYFI